MQMHSLLLLDCLILLEDYLQKAYLMQLLFQEAETDTRRRASDEGTAAIETKAIQNGHGDGSCEVFRWSSAASTARPFVQSTRSMGWPRHRPLLPTALQGFETVFRVASWACNALCVDSTEPLSCRKCRAKTKTQRRAPTRAVDRDTPV